MDSNNKTAVFANGCFWCTEAVFTRLKGVVSVRPGYTGGHTTAPTYAEVCRGDTGHAEAIEIEYNPAVISYQDLLTVFFYTHDPTTLNRQGNDIGTQYRSAIFYSDDTEKKQAEDFIAELEDKNAYQNPIVTEVQPLQEFFLAEDYHRDYYERNPNQAYCNVVITPKIEKLTERFGELLK